MKNYFKWLDGVIDSGAMAAVSFMSVIPIAVFFVSVLQATLDYDTTLFLLLPLYMGISGVIFNLIAYLGLEPGEEITLKDALLLMCVAWMVFPAFSIMTLWYIVSRPFQAKIVIVRKK